MTRRVLVVAEFVFSAEGEEAFLEHRQRTLDECRRIDGCLQAVVWMRPGRHYQFSTLWSDEGAVKRWVENEFHRQVLMPGFRKWCVEGSFGEYELARDHPRARKCGHCGRWTQFLPGWDEHPSSICAKCGVPLAPPLDSRPAP